MVWENQKKLGPWLSLVLSRNQTESSTLKKSYNSETAKESTSWPLMSTASLDVGIISIGREVKLEFERCN